MREPFVPVALIAPVRRILVITAEFGTLTDRGESAFRYPMIELGLLTVMTGVLVTCLVGLRKRDEEAVAERAWAGLPAPGMRPCPSGSYTVKCSLHRAARQDDPLMGCLRCGP